MTYTFALSKALMFAVLIAGMAGVVQGAASIQPAHLKCEYRTNPLGIDEREPRLSWELTATDSQARGLVQKAYRITAASTAEGLASGPADVWDSGRVESSESTQIVYQGKPLQSNRKIFWRVQVWDAGNVTSAWSETAYWSMGLLHAEDWKAQWIGADETSSYQHPESIFHLLKGAHWIWSDTSAVGQTSYFRTSFAVPAGRSIRRAILLIGADARYEAFLNGRSLLRGTYVRMPDFLDVTPDVQPGSNLLAVSAVAGQSAGLISAIHMEFASGQPLTLYTSPSWKADAQSSDGWQLPSFHDSTWKAAHDNGAYGREPWGAVGFSEERALPVRMLRKELQIERELKRATAYVSGLGLSEFYLNGSKVGDHVLSPGLTAYEKRVLYVTYDVTSNLKQGLNAAGLILGNGRYWAPRDTIPIGTRSFGYPKAICQIELEFSDGSRQTVVTDQSWKLTTDGPIRQNNEYDGEFYDANREITGWATAGFDEARWSRVQLVGAPAGALMAQMAEPLRVVESVRPRAITEPEPGVFVFDMGQNMVGWCRLKVSGKAGTPVTLRHAETLKDGLLYLDNLRTARALDTYVLKGSGSESWEPRFTYHGFRYVEVRGYPGKPTLDSIEGRVVHDDMQRIGDFESSDTLLNQIHHNIVWGVRGNYRSIPTDCPQRDERQGWLGDRSMVSRSESYLYDIAAFYTKWHHDLEDAQNAAGGLPDVVPTYWTMYNDDVTWPSTFLFVPGMLLDQYGDTRVVTRAYPAMKKWVEHMRGFVKDGLMTKDTYGDWCVPPENKKLIHSEDPARKTDGTLIATAYFQYLLELMARYATIAGQDQDAAGYRSLAADMRAAFELKYFAAERGIYGNGSQTSDLLPLATAITPQQNRAKVMASLVQKIERESQDHVGVGLIGAQWLMRTLSENGEQDLAFKIATQTDYPGWGYMIQKGATTIWELWNGDTADPAMNSGNHVMQIGDLGLWLYTDLGGIRSDVAHPGFRRTVIHPVIPAKLTSVSVSHRSLYGNVATSWKHNGEQFDLKITVPPNTTAEVYVPSRDASPAVTESGASAERAAGVHFLRREGKASVFEVGSGEYSFRSEY